MPISLRRLYAQSPFDCPGFLCGVTTSAFFSLGPLWAQRRGFDNEAIAFFMASGTIVACLAMSVAERGLSITIITAQLLIALWGAYRFSFGQVSPSTSKADFVVEPPVPVRGR